MSIADEVEAFLRGSARGGVDLTAADHGLSEDAIARELERRLQAYARYVTHRERQRPGDMWCGTRTMWGFRYRIEDPESDDQRRHEVLRYAREFAARSEAQRRYFLGRVRGELHSRHRLICDCSPLLCHAQVLAYWALTGRDPLKPAPDSGAHR